MNKQQPIEKLEAEWAESPRWSGTARNYSATEVVQLRGTIQVEHTLARHGAEKLWQLVNQQQPLCALGALTGNQAIQEVQAGLKAIYCSGWQVAGDGNSSGEMYPDQSLYPVDSVPKMVSRINNALQRTDEIHALNDDSSIDWFAPIIADAEAGFGGIADRRPAGRPAVQQRRGRTSCRGGAFRQAEAHGQFARQPQFPAGRGAGPRRALGHSAGPFSATAPLASPRSQPATQLYTASAVAAQGWAGSI